MKLKQPSTYSEFLKLRTAEKKHVLYEKPVIRCNNCMRLFHHEEELKQLKEEGTGDIINGCPDCKTDSYLMDLEN